MNTSYIKELWKGDCLKLMDYIPDNSINLIKADLPFGSTQNVWDIIIPFEQLWKHYNRIIKPEGVILLNAVGLFGAKLIMSNPDMYKYDWIWEKTKATGHLNSKKQPLRAHEQILVFYKKQPLYNFQKTTGHKRKVSTAYHKRNSKKTENYGEYGLTTYDSTERFPRSVLKFKHDTQISKLHSTQKPVALEEYLIKTYTNIGDLVLDNCAGSGTVAIACENLDRQYICIEKGELQYGDMVKRIERHRDKIISDIF